ncbi:MAG: helix-turn-helix domain-containing protein [Actinobacteria bacterium]|nr:helix-turn-helix domain-containing protein [Actinomycetota bacterium]
MTSTGPFCAPAEPRDVVTLLPPPICSAIWSGTSDHMGIVRNWVVVVPTVATPWSLPFQSPAPTAAEQVARLRDRVIEAAGLSKQDIARGIGVDRRSLSGFVTGEIRPSPLRVRALEVLAESAEWAATRFGVRARDVLQEDAGQGAPLDLIAAGRTSVVSEMELGANALGLVRTGAVAVRRRSPNREPLYLKARDTWSAWLDKPTAGGQVRDLTVYEQNLSDAAESRPSRGRPRRKRI